MTIRPCCKAHEKRIVRRLRGSLRSAREPERDGETWSHGWDAGFYNCIENIASGWAGRETVRSRGEKPKKKGRTA